MFKNYNTNQLILPLDLELTLDKQDIVFAVHQLVESIPEEAFGSFSHTQGASSYPPQMMLKLILCAYTQSVFSGRKIEALIQDSLRMMWLAQGYRPSYRTINRFRVHPDVQELLKECFIQFRNHLVSEQLIDQEAIFIDGTKIEANANKFTFVWRKSVERYQTQMEEKSLASYQNLLEKEIIPSIRKESEELLTEKEVTNIVQQLERVIDEQTTAIEQEPVGSKRKLLRSLRKEPKRFLKHFHSHQERIKKYVAHYALLGDRNSYSKTDTEATFMRMKDDYMKNGQLKAGYNLQIATNSQYILGYDCFSNPTDTRTLRPFLTTLQEQFFDLPPYLVADAGYGSEENYQTVTEEFKRIPLITYGMYEKEKKKKYKNNPFHPDNWTYDESLDSYVCPEQRSVAFRNQGLRCDQYGFTRTIRFYQCETCLDCSVRAQCTKSTSTHARVIQKNRKWLSYKGQMKQLLSEEKTGAIYRRRKIDVEPAFGFLKAILGFTRLSVRGKEQVKNELGFALLAVNLRKLTVSQRETTRKKENNRKKERISLFFLQVMILSFFAFRTYVPSSFFVKKENIIFHKKL